LAIVLSLAQARMSRRVGHPLIHARTETITITILHQILLYRPEQTLFSRSV
jgi:hypothetical protein